MRFGRRPLPILVAVVIALIAVPALAAVPLTRVSTDPYTNTASQHQTEVEPDTFSFGSTTHDHLGLPGGAGLRGRGGQHRLGPLGQQRGHLDQRVPARHHHRGQLRQGRSAPSATRRWPLTPDMEVWLISSLGIRSNGINQVVTSRSTNGGLTWSNPVVTSTTGNPDKNWIVCDNTTTSPFYGRCYTEWDNTADGNRIKMQTSSNGGPAGGRPATAATTPPASAASRWCGPTAPSWSRWTTPTSPRSARSARSMAAPPGGPRCWCPASAATPWPAACAPARCPRPRWTRPAPPMWSGRTAASAPAVRPTTSS